MARSNEDRMTSEFHVNAEYEIKARLEGIDVQPLLADAQFVGQSKLVDVYFDVPGFKLFECGVFVRIRNQEDFDIKYNPNFQDIAHTFSEELNFPWPLSVKNAGLVSEFLGHFAARAEPQTSDVVQAFKLQELVTIRKERKHFEAVGIEIFIDDVEGLGAFIEVEASNAEKFRRVSEFCNAVGLRNIETGYVELYLRKYNFDLYRRGRYVLPEDKNRVDGPSSETTDGASS